ncbi:hypothetical protein VNO77_19903 [Canavalia gladiata]|uniref:Uncharacterized protein n=1 Tax=Canavalia gladiata TaxID=3824 RepID=A0AAN9LSF2_CANGL
MRRLCSCKKVVRLLARIGFLFNHDCRVGLSNVHPLFVKCLNVESRRIGQGVSLVSRQCIEVKHVDSIGHESTAIVPFPINVDGETNSLSPYRPISNEARLPSKDIILLCKRRSGMIFGCKNFQVGEGKPFLRSIVTCILRGTPIENQKLACMDQTRMTLNKSTLIQPTTSPGRGWLTPAYVPVYLLRLNTTN